MTAFILQEAAEKAAETFENTFKKGEVPDNVKTVLVDKDALLMDVVLKEELVASKSEFRRLIEEKAVRENHFFAVEGGTVIRKHRPMVQRQFIQGFISRAFG